MPVKVEDLCIESCQSILDAFLLLDKNAQGVLFVVEAGQFLGTLTDGDLRRAMINGATREDGIRDFCMMDALSLSVDASDADIQAHLSGKIKIIPLLDTQKRVVDYASILRLRRIPLMEPLLGGNELEYVSDCLRTNWISSQGAYVTRFEKMLAEYCGVEYCVATSNGTVSLHLALVVLGIGPGDEVIVPDLTFAASVNAILHSGAKPVLVDIEKTTWNLSPAKVRAAITPKTKAIMPVHLYGNPCEMAEILKISEEHDLKVIEDSAEALGAHIDGKLAGSFGDASAFSFFGNKVITCGEGGAILFRKKEDYELALQLRDHGMVKGKRYWHEKVGYNYRLTNMQAAVGCAQLEQIKSFRIRRKKIFQQYNELLLPSGFFDEQELLPGYEGSYWLYTLCVKEKFGLQRDHLITDLLKMGVDTRPVFYPMSDMPAFVDVARSEKLEISRNISYRGISLPSSITLSPNDIKWVCECVLGVLNKRITL